MINGFLSLYLFYEVVYKLLCCDKFKFVFLATQTVMGKNSKQLFTQQKKRNAKQIYINNKQGRRLLFKQLTLN